MIGAGGPSGAVDPGFLPRDRLDVVGVHAVSDAAEVVRLEVRRDRGAGEQLVHDPVRAGHGPVAPDLPVAAAPEARGPVPAPVGLGLDLR